MKSFKYLFLVSIIFLSIVSFDSNASYAGSLTAVLGDNGLVTLSGSDSFECAPPNACVMLSSCLIPPGSTSCGPAPFQYICGSSSIDFVTTADLRCAYPGNYRFLAQFSGGRLVGENCVGTGHPDVEQIVNLPYDRETSVNSPNGRVTGTEDISVSYHFSYMTDSCSSGGIDRCMGRSLTINVRNNGITYPVYYQTGATGLGLEGTVSVPFNFANLSGFSTISATACCLTCRTSEKIVYKDPDDLGNPAGNPDESPGSSESSNNPSKPSRCLGNTGVGKPVNLANGNVFKSETDFSLAGVMPIHFTRYYNRKDPSSRGFGQFWGHTFDTRVAGFGTIAYKIVNADGSIFYYNDTDGDRVYDPEFPKGVTSKLIKNPNNTFKREFKDGASEEFNTYGYLTAVVDRNGNRITLTRDANNSVTRITDASGRQINITNTQAKITSITLPDGKVYTYSYLPTGYLGSVTYPDGSRKDYEYVYIYGLSYRPLSGIKNENGNYIEKHTYNSTGRAITSSADGTNERLTIAYVDDSHSTVTDSLGRVTTYTINKTGGKSHATNISGPGCKECGQGNVSYTYDDNLNVTSITDGNGNITTMTYDANGNMLTKTEAQGSAQQRTTTYTYNSFGQPLTITDPASNTTTFTYDEKGNLLSTTDSQENITSFTYNSQGLMTSMTDPQGNITTYAYNQYGNLISVTDYLGHVTSYTYDTVGRLLTMTDANNNQTTYTYDQKGRLTQVRDSLNQTTTYTYDPAGNLMAITDARNNTTQFAYDSINRLITETNPLGNQRTYSYNSESDLTSKTDANGQTTTYIYDDYNRLTTINHPGGLQTTFTYDNIGNMTGATNPNISYTMTYDALNRKTSVTDSLSRSINYTYDANFNKVTMTDPSGTTTYIYNTLNRLTSLTDPAAKIYTFTYDTTGKRTGLALPNEVTVSYTYDNVSRLLSIVNGSVSTNSYVYDNVSNRTSMTNPSGTHNYGYDVIYRLLQATHPVPPTELFTYDSVGNRLTDGLGNSYFYNNANRLLNYNGVSFTYDANGNITSRVNTCGTTTYTWDSENRLTGISGFQPDCSALSASYKYDPFGRRIETNVNGTVTKYLYDEEDILLEYDGNNQITAHYTHGPGIDEPLSMDKNSQKYYYHLDGLGSVTGITDSTGNIIQRYDYDSFGNIVSMLDPNFKQPYTYTSREYDKETGLYFYRARYYDSTIGRFISEDPIGFNGGSINFYSYVGNNPINWIDPFGLWRSPWTIYDEALKDAQSKFSRRDLWNGLGDAYRHCVASCMMAREDSSSVASVFGWANEKRGDWFNNQESGERAMDDFNNAYGQQCAKGSKSTQDCQQKCMNAVDSGNLKTYTSGTTSGYWY